MPISMAIVLFKSVLGQRAGLLRPVSTSRTCWLTRTGVAADSDVLCTSTPPTSAVSLPATLRYLLNSLLPVENPVNEIRYEIESGGAGSTQPLPSRGHL